MQMQACKMLHPSYQEVAKETENICKGTNSCFEKNE